MNKELSFDIPLSALKEASNCTFLDMDGNLTTSEKIQEELNEGYRVGVILILVPRIIQLQIVIATPYKQEGDLLDGGFLIDVYNRHVLEITKDEELCLTDATDYFLGEVIH